SLNAFYALLALLPVTGIPLLIGGVTGSEFWRMSLALVNMLFVSLAVGMFVSALAQSGRAAVFGTFAVLLVLAAGFPAIGELLEAVHLPAPARWIRWASPFSPFYFSMDSAFTRKPAGFWPALVMSNSLAWACLALAGWQLGRHWQDRPAQEGGKGFRVLRD